MKGGSEMSLSLGAAGTGAWGPLTGPFRGPLPWARHGRSYRLFVLKDEFQRLGLARVVFGVEVRVGHHQQ